MKAYSRRTFLRGTFGLAAVPALAWSVARCDATDPTVGDDLENSPPDGDETDNPQGDPEPRPPDPIDPPYY